MEALNGRPRIDDDSDADDDDCCDDEPHGGDNDDSDEQHGDSDCCLSCQDKVQSPWHEKKILLKARHRLTLRVLDTSNAT